MIGGLARKRLSKLLTGEAEIALVNRVPSVAELGEKLQEIDELGIYLHIPFCAQMCPYCPYNREIFRADVAREYAAAVIREIDLYADVLGKRPITSLYIGGGTPTTMLHSGIEDILEHLEENVEAVTCLLEILDLDVDEAPVLAELANLYTVEGRHEDLGRRGLRTLGV